MSYRNYIGGHWVESDDGATLVVRDPADDTVVGEVPLCGAAETRRAIAAAAASLPGLQATEPATRAERVSVLSRLMDERRVELAALLTREQGKPLAESEGEVDYARSYLDTAVLEFRRMRRERSLDAEETGKDVFVEAAPVGVVGVITPWNFPLAMLAKKLGPAGCLGCPMVVKPAEDTPLTTLLLAELAEQAGFPPGAFNVVTGSPEAIGGELMSDPRVRLVSFTGSTETGRLLVRAADRTLTRLLLELGGHAPFILTESASIEAALDGLVTAKFRNGGQTCVCPNRILVPESLHDRFVDGLAARLDRLVVGRGDRPGVDLGPLVNDAAIAGVEAQVRDAVGKGARVVRGGERLALPGLADRFFAPTLLDGCTSEMDCFRIETFGPVCPVRTYRSLEEAIVIANELPAGLAAYVWTGDREEGVALARRLECGIVGINDPSPVTAFTPFGGVKQSGWGHEGGAAVLGEYAPPKTYSLGRFQGDP